MVLAVVKLRGLYWGMNDVQVMQCGGSGIGTMRHVDNTRRMDT